MKKLVVVVSVLLAPLMIMSQEFSSKINRVTVFTQGAQLERTAKVQLKKGVSTIVVKGLSRYVDANSIQAKIPGVKIVSLSYELDYLSDEESNLDKKKLETAIEDADFKLKTLKNEKLNVEQELKLIQTNVNLKGQAVLDVADVEEFLIFYRSNLPLIRKTLLRIEVDTKTTQKEIRKLKRELRKLNNTQQKVSGLIELEVTTTAAANKELNLTYFVRNAGWSPFYNLRAQGIQEPIELEFNANVYQNTGVEWKEVNLTLATGSPQMDGNAPMMYRWYVDYYQPRKRNHQIEQKRSAKLLESNTVDFEEEPEEVIMSVAGISANASYAPSATYSENVTFQEYKITSLYNIPSTGKQQRVEIQVHKMPAEYTYFTAPKLNPTAYLMAKIPSWEQYNLLSGNSKIYFEDTYVGQAYIDANSTEDTLSMSLGQDKNVVIERKVLTDKSSKSIIGNKQTKKKSYLISIRNTKSKSVTIEVVDQIPLSKRKEIKVELKESSDAHYNEATGELKWLITLQPNEKMVKTFEFEVTFPKNQTLNW